jgi:hypothetical protein
MTVQLKRTIVWDVTTSSRVEAHRRFGGTYHFHLQNKGTSQANHHSFDPDDGGGALL